MKQEYIEIPKPRSQGGGHKQDSLINRFWMNVHKTKTCWIWQGTKVSNGYGRIVLYKKPLSVHRVAYEIQNGEIPKGMLVCHKCDVPLCVRGDHLFVGSHQDNENDKWSKGRGSYGSNHPNAKLSERIIPRIRMDRNNGFSLNVLAHKYNVSKKLILLIVQGKIWKHVD